MQEQAKTLLSSSAPWKKGVAWPIVAIEGLILIGLGIYVLVATDDARDVVLAIIAAVLLVNGALELIAAYRGIAAAAAPIRLVRGSIGFTTGAIATLEPFTDDLNKDASRFILAVGLLLYGIAGLTGAIMAREESGLRIGVVVIGVLCIALSIILFTGDETDSSRMDLLGAFGIIFGALLVLYAIYLQRGGKAASPSSPVAPTPAT
jgi:uncharacterized membrane protein HdeD (DUF308 family)